MRPVSIAFARINPSDGSTIFTIHARTEGHNAGSAAMTAIRRIAEMDSTTAIANELARAGAKPAAWQKVYWHSVWRIAVSIPESLKVNAEPTEILCPFVA